MACKIFAPLLVLMFPLLFGAMTPTADAQPTSQSINDEISYSNDIRPIVNNFCTTCHAGADPDGEFVLTSYKDVRKCVEDGALLERVNDAGDPMPPAGLIPKHMRRMFKIWADTGYIENGKARKKSDSSSAYGEFTPPTITPVDINEQGFELLEKVQGHWVGSMNLMGQEFEWMAFDFRAIAPSHIHAIFEGGAIGNLFTSFFVTNFNGKRTIMARNGGLLNGIYRTSYFVLDKIEKRKNKRGQDETYYRLIDSYGGKDIMWMELSFAGDNMQFNAYTSRFGLNFPAKPHMDFKGKRMHPELAKQAATAVGFPKNVLDMDFAKGLPKPDWGDENPLQTSASYLWEDIGKPIEELAKVAKDPYPITKMPHLSRLTVEIERNATIKGKNLLLYLSQKPLTRADGKFITEYGYLETNVANTLLMFPEITGTMDKFTFTYLHPGEYYLTVVADMNGDSLPSPGDVAAPSKRIVVKPKSHPKTFVSGVIVKN